MNIAQKLRQMADSTGLDGFAEELRALAEEVERPMSEDERAAMNRLLDTKIGIAQDSYSYAGVKVWIGAQQVTQHATEAQVKHERVKGQTLTNAAHQCIASLGLSAPAAEQAEPVGVVVREPLGGFLERVIGVFNRPIPVGANLYTHAQPAREPMTQERIAALVLEANAAPVATPTQAMEWIVRTIEAHHGITAQAGEGKS